MAKKGQQKRSKAQMSRVNQGRVRNIKQHRKRRKLKEKLAAQTAAAASTPFVVSTEDDQSYWEVDKVVGRRKRHGRVEYLIRWKGCSDNENTWEPCENLCDTAMAEAIQFAKSLSLLRKQSDAVEKDLVQGTSDHDFPVTEDKVRETKGIDALEDGRWTWTDMDQVQFRDIQRLDVNSADARTRVSEARRSGIPIVLVGHVGWANFSRRWLVEDCDGDQEGFVDLSLPHQLDIQKMMEDIGMEEVPVVKKNYNEENPIHASMLASRFLSSHWSVVNKKRPTASLYLHQWQFPLSDTAGRKLCHQSNPLPNDILGEDLLKHWVDLPQCKGDSPLQYIFMGGSETMSKLHRDCGGLDISIAPIVGEKECLLVHRSDGPSCLYHLEADLENIDLHAFPLMAQARIWKSVIRPGEILLMPQGTYHQCRNVTPCLSYSRFHLDKLNLLPFLQSMMDGDAAEIDHGEVLWNCATELVRRVDAYTDRARSIVKSNEPAERLALDEATADIVDTLRAVRNACREVARRIEVKRSEKRKWRETWGPGSRVMDVVETMGPTKKLVPVKATKAEHDQHHWDIIVDDIDICLHEFRYRHLARIPSIVLRNSKSKVLHFEDVPRRVGVGSGGGTTVVSDSTEETKHMADFTTSFRALPNAPSHFARMSLTSVEFRIGANLLVCINGKKICGEIRRTERELSAAFLSYDGYPSEYDEFQPFERLRVIVGGEGGAQVMPDDLKPGSVVMNRWGAQNDEYRATVQYTTTQPFVLVGLELAGATIERWVPHDSVLGL